MIPLLASLRCSPSLILNKVRGCSFVRSAEYQKARSFTSILGHRTTPYQKQVKIAFRLIPVLEPTDAESFLIQEKIKMTQKCSLIVSYALSIGDKYETNKKLASSSQHSITEEKFEEGTIFRVPFIAPDKFSQFVQLPHRVDQIINCYYTSKGFEKLVNRCGFKIVELLEVGQHSDNGRSVAVQQIKK